MFFIVWITRAVFHRGGFQKGIGHYCFSQDRFQWVNGIHGFSQSSVHGIRNQLDGFLKAFKNSCLPRFSIGSKEFI
jgi:hypothetical protein